MNYFAVKKAEQQFREYRKLALEYWEAERNEDHEREEQLRERINELFYEVNTNATLLNAGVTAHSLPPAVVGGPAVPVNFLRGVVEPDQGWRAMSQRDALDAIDRCIGAASYHRRTCLNRLLNPFAWLVDVPSAIVRWPFLIMRKAGVSPKIEDHVIAQVVKVIGTIALLVAAAYFGVRFTLNDVLEIIRR